MDLETFEKKYAFVSKRCGLIAGIWPFASKRSSRMGQIFSVIFIIVGISTQIAEVLVNLSTDMIIEQIPFFIIGTGSLIKETNYIIHSKQLKAVMESMIKDWNNCQTKSELAIMHKYTRRGMFFNCLYVGNGLFAFIIFIIVSISPRVMDLVSPKNESRGVGFIYPAYYGVDKQEHYYILFGHMLITTTVVYFIYMSCDSIHMTVVQHACALLSISGHRFKTAIEESYMNGEKMNAIVMKETYNRVRHSIKAHQRAIEYIAKIEEIHARYLFIIVAMIIFTFSVTLLKTSMMDMCLEFFKYCGFLLLQLSHLLFIAIQGHFVIVAHDVTYDSMCTSKWYESEPRTQALYMLALRRNLTPPLLTAGGLISLNLETFSTILKTSVSWFTVIQSTM